MWWWLCALLAAFVAFVAYLMLFYKRGERQRVDGAVFVTGCDSGMGETIAFALAAEGYDVYAACYMKESCARFSAWTAPPSAKGAVITPLVLDVSDDAAVAAAATTVAAKLGARGGARSKLYGVIQCAGIAACGPAEYLPVKYYRQQMAVNFHGYVAVAQAFLPLLKRSATARDATRRGRMAFIGTGGGVPGVSAPFITAYMASKWAGEAYSQGLRLELRMRNVPIDVCHINPGHIKPTKLIENGIAFVKRVFAELPAAVGEQYGSMFDAFVKFNQETPGTHVREVGKTAIEIMAAGHLRVRYRVGFDSYAGQVVGLLPTGAREWLLRNTMYAHYEGPPRVAF